jgi:hypothetical protein
MPDLSSPCLCVSVVERTQIEPVRFTAKQKPHRPGIAPALGLRAGLDVSPL